MRSEYAANEALAGSRATPEWQRPAPRRAHQTRPGFLTRIARALGIG